MVDAVIQSLSWDNIKSFLNSNFTAALAGAFFGALAAQRIGARAKQREELLSDIRSTNAAIMLAFIFCNAGLALKKQLVKEIYDRYIATRTALNAHIQRHSAAKWQSTFEFQADLRAVQMPLLPLEVLRVQIFEKGSVTGRPLAVTAALIGSVEALAEILTKRTELIEQIRALSEGNDQSWWAMYFGLPYADGRLSEEFPDTVESMYRLTDDIIFFGELLASDLMTHGKNLVERRGKRGRFERHKESFVDFAKARKEGLMPDAANYADWLKGFVDKSA